MTGQTIRQVANEQTAYFPNHCLEVKPNVKAPEMSIIFPQYTINIVLRSKVPYKPQRNHKLLTCSNIVTSRGFVYNLNDGLTALCCWTF